MKKLSFFASLMLAAGFFNSCAVDDNSIDFKQDTVVELDGQEYTVGVIATLVGNPGDTVSIKVGVYADFDIYGVDFGDGEVIADSVFNKNSKLTTFKGAVKGDGNITIFGNSSLWYLGLSGYAVPTSYTQAKLKRVQQLTMSQLELDGVDLTGLDSLRQFQFTQAALTTINVAGNPELTSLTINNNSKSNYESKLLGLDLSKNTKLESLNVMGAEDKPGLLTELDLSNNPALKQVYAQYNKLKSIKLPADATISFLNVQNNELEELDLSGLASVKDIYASDNKLAAIDLSKLKEKATINVFNNELTELVVPVDVKTIQAQNNKLAKVELKDVTSMLKLEENEFTFSSLPTKPASLKAEKYTYAPQTALVPVALHKDVVDLTTEAKAQGILEAPVATNFKFISETGLELTELNDYSNKDGVFTFFRVQDNIHAELTSDAFPGLTLETESFAIKMQTDEPIVPFFGWKAEGEAPEAGATLIDNDVLTVKTTFATTLKNPYQSTICGVDFTNYIQVRADAAPTAEVPEGTEKSGSTTLIVTAKKDLTIKSFYRRQTGDGFVAGDGKDLKCFEHASANLVDGTIEFDETLTDLTADYGHVAKSFNLEAGKTYTLFGRGTTICFYGFSYAAK